MSTIINEEPLCKGLWYLEILTNVVECHMISKAFKNSSYFILISSFYFLFCTFVIMLVTPGQVYILEAYTKNVLLIRGM